MSRLLVLIALVLTVKIMVKMWFHYYRAYADVSSVTIAHLKTLFCHGGSNTKHTYKSTHKEQKRTKLAHNANSKK